MSTHLIRCDGGTLVNPNHISRVMVERVGNDFKIRAKMVDMETPIHLAFVKSLEDVVAWLESRGVAVIDEEH